MRALSLLVFAVASLELVHSAPRSANNGLGAPRRRGTTGCPAKSNTIKQQQLQGQQQQQQAGQQQQQQAGQQQQQQAGQQQQQQAKPEDQPKEQQQAKPEDQPKEQQQVKPEDQPKTQQQAKPEDQPKTQQEKPQSEKPKIPPRPADEKLPNTVILDPLHMVETRWLVKHDEYPKQLEYVVEQANEFYSKPPWSVYNKTMQGPNAFPGDYVSQAPFWWPNNWENPNEGEVCPYVRRDGERNPEVDNKYDRLAAAEMMFSSYYLTLAWWYIKDDVIGLQYRAKAGQVLRTWFLDEKTRMKPHLNHAQFIPCSHDGRTYGVVDFAQQYTGVTEAVALLNTAFDEHWSKEDADAFNAWNREYLKWLTESDFGVDALWAQGSRGNYAIMQVAAIAAFLGEKETAAEYLQEVFARIDHEIQADGQQPIEMSRTRPWHFATANLVAFFRMDAIGRRAGIDVDLWSHVGPDGQSLQAAIDFLTPYSPFKGPRVWPSDEKRLRAAAHSLIRYAADRGSPMAKEYLDKIDGMLDWNLVPACEQFDIMIWS